MSAAAAYDSLRRRVVLFGGYGDRGFSSETWEWDGTTWTQRLPTVSPPPRCKHAMSFDTARNRVVLFGGADEDVLFGDTWEWDGTNWTQRVTAVSPGMRSGTAMAYDRVRQRTVLCSGSGPSLLADTWEWDGTVWSRAAPATHPPVRTHHTMAYDVRSGRVVLFGGTNVIACLRDLWTWDGVSWVQSVPGSGDPLGRVDHVSAYDTARGCFMVFGGQSGRVFPYYLNDLWAWDGSAWSQSTPPVWPSERLLPAMAYDEVAAQSVLFGGAAVPTTNCYADTWTWTGTRWLQRNPATSPPARRGHCMAFDPLRRRVVLFGGSSPTGELADTWEWDGTQWTQKFPAQSPALRSMAAMAWSASHGLLLFGGAWRGLEHADTWAWDGTNWTQLMPLATPPARHASALCADPRGQGRLLLFGGETGTTRLGDTWSFDGATWRLEQPAHSPSARAYHALVFDSLRSRAVLFAGEALPTSLTDTWEWDGVDWTQRQPVTSPRSHYASACAFDARRGKVVLFAGLDSGGALLQDLWEYGPLAPASSTRFGSGCAGSAGVPALEAATGQRPWLLDALTLVGQSLPPTAPVLGLLGTSRTSWSGLFALPLDLAGVGMPGCALQSSGQVLQALASSNGSARWTLAIPGSTEFVGRAFYNQLLALDPGANPAGMTVSNAIENVIGAR